VTYTYNSDGLWREVWRSNRSEGLSQIGNMNNAVINENAVDTFHELKRFEDKVVINQENLEEALTIIISNLDFKQFKKTTADILMHLEKNIDEYEEQEEGKFYKILSEVTDKVFEKKFKKRISKKKEDNPIFAILKGL